MKFTLPIFVSMAILVGAFSVNSCAPKKKLAIEEPVVEEPEEGTDELESKIEINQEWSEIPSLSVINFLYDKAKLDARGKGILKENVSILKKLPQSVTIRVEGHCDDRGTIEYNIALGQRRASTVRSFYIAAGIVKKRVEAISYGEERPVCNYQTDGCWARNRRSVTKVRNKEPLSISTQDLE